jgi:hypothetical protein
MREHYRSERHAALDATFAGRRIHPRVTARAPRRRAPRVRRIFIAALIVALVYAALIYWGLHS